jgi:hypothetical protein
MSQLTRGKTRTKKITVLSEDDVDANNAVLTVDSNNIRFSVADLDVFNIGKEGIQDFFITRNFTWYSFQADTGIDPGNEWFAGGLQILDTNGTNLVDQQAVLWTKDQNIPYGTTLYNRLVLGMGGLAVAITEGGGYVEPLYIGIPYAAGVGVSHRFLYISEANYEARTPDSVVISYSTGGLAESDPRSLSYTVLDTYNPEAQGSNVHTWPTYP